MYQLQVDFPEHYAMESPQVVFIPPAPLHPHIYSNGHICLDILYDSWFPAMTVSSICISILSMLSSSTAKTSNLPFCLNKRPADNDRCYVKNCRNGSPLRRRDGGSMTIKCSNTSYIQLQPSNSNSKLKSKENLVYKTSSNRRTTDILNLPVRIVG